MIAMKTFLTLLFLMVGLMACSPSEQPVVETPVEKITNTPQLPTHTQTPFAPSATPMALVASVNGDPITRETYEAELARFRGASEGGLVDFPEEKVLTDLIDQTLLAQAAAEAGFVITDDILQERLRQWDIDDQVLDAWMTTYGYSPESFVETMRRSIAAAWMRDQIMAEVPGSVEQVHARQILLYNSEEAERIYQQLQAGTEFGTLAEQYDPLTKGDLGWFPRGYLTVPELDDVVFALRPGEYSPVIQTLLGYHIIQVLERDPSRPLSSDAYRVLQIQAVQQWLETRRDQSEIKIYLP